MCDRDVNSVKYMEPLTDEVITLIMLQCPKEVPHPGFHEDDL